MEKISYSELKKALREHNDNAGITVKGTDPNPITGVIVFKESNWDKEYSLESRSYRVSSANKAFLPNIGYSIFGSALDGSDPYVRLEQYMADEYAGEDGWKVDYCYLEEE